MIFVWWNGHIDPASIDLGATIDLLVIAVVGGLYRLEGAWVGALFFVIINNYSQRIGFIGPRFHTLIGAIFLVIVLVSPGGLVGLWERAVNLFSGRRRGPLDRTPRSQRGIEFDSVVDFGLAAEAGGIDEDYLAAVQSHWSVDRIAGGAGAIGDHQPLFPE